LCNSSDGNPDTVNLSRAMLEDVTENCDAYPVSSRVYKKYPYCKEKEDLPSPFVYLKLFIFANEFLGHSFSCRESYFVGFFRGYDIWG
jgi:hypothetical protein